MSEELYYIDIRRRFNLMFVLETEHSRNLCHIRSTHFIIPHLQNKSNNISILMFCHKRIFLTSTADLHCPKNVQTLTNLLLKQKRFQG